ncbi:acyl-CoA thioesterase [Micrococcus sp. HG099]|uniref:acyl-CoA thioesterase n=1 Tax=Micrococcus sp. HG099 TaxID=2969755 RepID=UPI00215A6523|nr:thioesterase family protein [Micrococcus sp. HG099]MCR8675783.1 acyl-CoA thioesterase [Micrococcus sp. HG099]
MNGQDGGQDGGQGRTTTDGATGREAPVPFETEIQVRWSDEDRYGHVNNARLLTLTEEARVRATRAWSGVTPGRDVHRVVRAMEVQYEAPVVYGPELTAKVWITRIGTSSYTLRHELWQDGRRCVLCDAVFVHVDPETGRSVALAEDERTTLERVLIPAEADAT